MKMYTMKVIFLKYQILIFFLPWNVKHLKVYFMVNVKMAKICTEKRINTSLKELSIALNNHGRHDLLSFLSSLPFLVFCNLELEANKLNNRANYLYKAALLMRC